MLSGDKNRYKKEGPIKKFLTFFSILRFSSLRFSSSQFYVFILVLSQFYKFLLLLKKENYTQMLLRKTKKKKKYSIKKLLLAFGTMIKEYVRTYNMDFLLCRLSKRKLRMEKS